MASVIAAKGRLRDNRWGVGLAFSLPLLTGLAVMTVYPILASCYLSFTDATVFKSPAPRWVGLANYRELLGEPQFWLSLWNTVYIAVFGVPLGILAGILLALLLNLKVRGMSFYRTMFFLPTVVPLIASCVLWNQLLNPQHGLINEGLRWMGLPESWMPGWLSDERWSKPGLILMGLWGCGGGMVLYLAALQDVPQDLYESAALDGANAWHRLIHVTLPMISPVVLFTLLTGLIGAAQYFAQAYVLTNGSGGPWDSTLVYPLKLFNTAFIELRAGYACAMAWVMFVVILIASLGVMKVANRFVYYHS